MKQDREWTPEIVKRFIMEHWPTMPQAYMRIADAHNAALNAELEDARKAREGWTQESRRADDAEAAVRENCRTIARLEEELSETRSALKWANEELSTAR